MLCWSVGGYILVVRKIAILGAEVFYHPWYALGQLVRDIFSRKLFFQKKLFFTGSYFSLGIYFFGEKINCDKSFCGTFCCLLVGTLFVYMFILGEISPGGLFCLQKINLFTR